jgi:hypothetical protein
MRLKSSSTSVVHSPPSPTLPPSRGKGARILSVRPKRPGDCAERVECYTSNKMSS